MELSYCVVNTNGRELLLAAWRRSSAPIRRASSTRSWCSTTPPTTDRRRPWPPDFREVRVIARDRRAGLAENNSLLMGEAQGRVLPAPQRGLRAPGRRRRGAPRGAGGRSRSRGRRGAARGPGRRADSLRLAVPGPGDGARPGALPPPAPGHPERHGGDGAAARGRLGPVVHDAGPARGRRQVGYLDPDFFVYSEEVDFQKRMHDAGWRILHVPRAARDPPRAARHRPLAGRPPPDRPVPPRPRPLHAEAPLEPVVLLSRLLWSSSYVPRALAAIFMRGRDPGTYWLHARQALRPGSGEGMREAADAYNAAHARGRSGPRAVLVARRDLVDLGPEAGMLGRVGPGVSRRRAKAAWRARRSRTGAGAPPGRCAPPRAGSRRVQDPRVGEPEHGAAAQADRAGGRQQQPRRRRPAPRPTAAPGQGGATRTGPGRDAA